ncbi:MAG: hypothetical protein PT120_22855 [Aphanizomenon gracile PMC649.10]|nr:hypothetical protein [Aphanizomenon gracile PMC649.10]
MAVCKNVFSFGFASGNTLSTIIAFPRSPKSDSYGALRYRTPIIPKNGTSHIPKANCLQQRFAIALSYSQNGFPGAIALFNKYD